MENGEGSPSQDKISSRIEQVKPPTFGEKVKESREGLGLSQRALSKKAHLSSNYVNRLESLSPKSPKRS
ncbi:helix-turn-helix domain-containing protein [Candidatus Daviesbacteria bacterium]|nr:helix-turn-helix domain-containing protein [Candidatus Daviesbacteria bacterium]